jgi:hypothetical protein
MRLMAAGDLRAEDEGIDRLVVPPQVQRAPRCFRHELVGHSRCDEQLPTGGVLLHSRRDVDRITQSSEVDHRTPDICRRTRRRYWGPLVHRTKKAMTSSAMSLSITASCRRRVCVAAM